MPAGKAFKIIVDLDKPLPDEWIGKVGFNFELFPQILFGKSYYVDQQSGIFPRQPNGPNYKDKDGDVQIVPMAVGRKLTIAPESDLQRMTIENLSGSNLELLDGRGKHNNGWFVVRSLVPKGAADRRYRMAGYATRRRRLEGCPGSADFTGWISSGTEKGSSHRA